MAAMRTKRLLRDEDVGRSGLDHRGGCGSCGGSRALPSRCGMSHAATAGQANGTFQLERFEWAAPDRLEIAGSFAGVEPPRAAPTLLVRADDGVRRLTGATADEAGDGDPWSAAFHWSEPPVPFSAA